MYSVLILEHGVLVLPCVSQRSGLQMYIMRSWVLLRTTSTVDSAKLLLQSELSWMDSSYQVLESDTEGFVLIGI